MNEPFHAKVRKTISVCHLERPIQGWSSVTKAGLRVVLPYVLFASLWIFLSDRLLAMLVSDPATLTRWAIYKGLAFVLVTAILLFSLLRFELGAFRKLNRALRTISECSQALVHANNETALLKNICQIVTHHGGYRLAWVGYAEQDEAKTVRPVAQEGFEEGYLETLKISWDDNERGQGPTGTAIRTGQPCAARTISSDPRFGPWRAEAVRRGYSSSLVLPLMNGGKAFGALNIYSAVSDAFDETEVKLLGELAADLAFGITTLRMRAEHGRAEEEVRLLHQDLQRHASELESRVAERTAELAVAKDRAEVADHLKSSFLATMSHELRTPLNSIIGFTGIMLQGLAGPLNPEQAKQLGMVKASARHLLSLINDVLDISKIEAGQLEVRHEWVDLGQTVEKAVASVRPQAQSRGLALEGELMPVTGQVMGDARRIEQVLINLLNNAIKFTEKGEVRVESEREEGWVAIRVIDTGIGIKPEDLANLFQPFRQLDSGLSRRHEGTGLGLAICRRLAELMGGEIHVASVFGKGSVFTFKLPAKP